MRVLHLWRQRALLTQYRPSALALRQRGGCGAPAKRWPSWWQQRHAGGWLRRWPQLTAGLRGERAARSKQMSPAAACSPQWTLLTTTCAEIAL